MARPAGVIGTPGVGVGVGTACTNRFGPNLARKLASDTLGNAKPEADGLTALDVIVIKPDVVTVPPGFGIRSYPSEGGLVTSTPTTYVCPAVNVTGVIATYRHDPVTGLLTWTSADASSTPADVHSPTWCVELSGTDVSNSQKPMADTVMLELAVKSQPAVCAVVSIVANTVPPLKPVTAGVCARQLPKDNTSKVGNTARLMTLRKDIAAKCSTKPCRCILSHNDLGCLF